MDDLTKQIELNFRAQLTDLEKRLVTSEKREQEQQQQAAYQPNQLFTRLEALRTSNTVLMVVAAIAIISVFYLLMTRG
ncbi:MAG: hypothetical protein EOO88_32170 [Pedobacter sp.]|nr:MAG: hypothetical protein EOO88_32170 [Pedobacter sp.]